MSTDDTSGSIYSAPESDTSTSGSDDLFAAYVGPQRAEYYKERFEKIASGGGSIGWHWPAFFFTSAWLLYRKMWLYALLYIFAVPFAVSFIAGMISAFTSPLMIVPLYYGGYFIYGFILMPMFANRLYFGHVKTKVDKISSLNLSEGQMAEELARKGGTSWLGFIFILIPIIGILAAIAIPAYNDYTIRAQVAEGLALSGGAKTAVAEYHQDTGSLPANNAEAGLPEPSEIKGSYVVSVTVENGEVVVLYGGDTVNSVLLGQTLVLYPEVGEGRMDGWGCYSETLSPQWLPAACRD